MTDKRHAPRAHHDSAPELYDDLGRRIESPARLVDFSESGLRLATTAVLRKGATIRGRLRLLKEGVREFSGRVLWLKEKENFNLYGVRFDWLR